jgi:valyl-tRNA synthetase
MNYKQFFNKLLQEAVNPTHEIPDDAINGILDDDTNPDEFRNDISVNGAPKSSVDDAKNLWENETSISGSTPEEKKVSIKKTENFLTKLNTYKSNLKNLSPEKKYTDIAILADLVSSDPDMSEKYTKLNAKIEKLKKAEELRKQAEQMEKDASSSESDVNDSGFDSQAEPLPSPQA